MNESSSQSIEFDAMEYQADGLFRQTPYRYRGSEKTGWEIFRRNECVLELPAGYRLLKTHACGICSTDIARAQLPFPLPQITGHEIVALDNGKPVVVEINASHYARDESSGCYYCSNGLANHCPDRLTLGIDRLPGGFAPYILAPVNAIIPLPGNFDLNLAVLVEPLAAAIRAIEKTPLENCKSVAVVGPRRLGALLLLALNHYREKLNLQFDLIAIIRNPMNKELCLSAGADEVLLSSTLTNKKFDVVFDTSGTLTGLELSLEIATKYIHLKSTNGKSFQGLDVLTELVIDELSLEVLKTEALGEILEQSKELLVDCSLVDKLRLEGENYQSYSLEYNEFPKAMNKTGQYDAVFISDITHLNALLKLENGATLIKPEGRVYLYSANSANKIQQTLTKNGVTLLTSRCGNFKKALNLLQKEALKLENFKTLFLTHYIDVNGLNDAFKIAKMDKACVKVVVQHMKNNDLLIVS